MPYLPKGCRPDFNNGLGGDSNSGPVLASGVYLSSTRIMAPPPATPILYQMKYTSPIYDFMVVTIVTKVNKLHSALGQVHLYVWYAYLGHVDVVGSANNRELKQHDAVMRKKRSMARCLFELDHASLMIDPI